MDFLGETIYNASEPPPRVRDPSKPMQVICPGLPRQFFVAGWDILFEKPDRLQGWARLCKKKWYGADDGDCTITAAEFDELIGHSVAVTDAAASVFAAEMIAAYPDAKVVLNVRRDLDAWHKSAIENIAGVYESWPIWFSSWWSTRVYWSWQVAEKYMWALLFRATDGNMSQAIRRNGKWIYREHSNMIRGLVPKDRLLEWSVEDGWESLCKFLGKEIPNEPFPRVNGPDGFAERVEEWYAEETAAVIRNFSIFTAVVAIGVGAATWRFAPERASSLISMLHRSAIGFAGSIKNVMR